MLRYAYKFKPNAISAALKKLFGLQNIHLQDHHTIITTLDWYDQGLDFADALHLAQSNQCETFITFDKNLAKASKALPSCPVKSP